MVLAGENLDSIKLSQLLQGYYVHISHKFTFPFFQSEII